MQASIVGVYSFSLLGFALTNALMSEYIGRPTAVVRLGKEL